MRQGLGESPSKLRGMEIEAVALDYVVLIVADLDAAIAFYRDGIGLSPRIVRPGFVEFATAGAGLALQDAAGGAATHGARILLTVADADTAWQTMAARGVRFEGPPADQPWEGGVRVATASDPDGNRVSLLSYVRRTGRPPTV